MLSERYTTYNDYDTLGQRYRAQSMRGGNMGYAGGGEGRTMRVVNMRYGGDGEGRIMGG